MQFRKLKVVCFGGGTGLPSLLAGLKHNPRLDITAVVNTFDTGGSSGELRDRFGILPPGDILKCLVALSEDEMNARKIFLRRILNKQSPGHTGGNVLLMGLEKVYGNYRDAVDALGQILSVKGRVLPVTNDQATLCARYSDGSIHKGEVSVDAGVHDGKEIEALFLEPTTPASDAVLAAITDADVLCIGPGSFYTSVISNFLPKGVKESIIHSNAPIVFVANLLTEGLGMGGYTVEKVVAILEGYIGKAVDAVLVNNKFPAEGLLAKYAGEKKAPLRRSVPNGDQRYAEAELWLDGTIARHDSDRLANLVFSAIERLTAKSG